MGVGGRSGCRGVCPRLDVTPPNARPDLGTPSPLRSGKRLRLRESDGSHLPSRQLRLFLPPRAPYPPAGRSGWKLRPTEDAEPEGIRSLQGPQLPAPPPLATRRASLGLEFQRKPSGRPRRPPNRRSSRLTSAGVEPRAPRPAFLLQQCVDEVLENRIDVPKTALPENLYNPRKEDITVIATEKALNKCPLLTYSSSR